MIKLLVKNRIKSVLASIVGREKGGKTVKASMGKIILFAFLYLYIAVVFVGLSAMMAFSLGAVLIPMGASWLYYGIFMLATLSVVFIFSIFETKSELFEGKDNELLLSMPIRPRDVVASRVSIVLIYNYLETLIVMAPAIVAYAIFSSGDPVGIIGGVAVALLLPLFATALASAVGYLVAMITRRMRKNSFVTLAISLAFLALYMLGYTYLMNGMEEFLENVGNNVAQIGENVRILYYLGSSALLSPIPLCLLAAVCIGAAAIAYYLISRSYVKLVTDVRGAKRAQYREKKSNQKSALFALIRKEFKKFISSSTYMLNSAIGLVFEVVLAVVAVINKSAISEALELFSEELGISGSDFIAPLMVVAILLMGSMNTMSASALSLEGNNLWILKSLPLSAKEVLLSKALPQIIITAPPALFASVMMIIATEASLVYVPFLIIIPQIANVAFAVFGLVINVAFPKFSFDNDAQPIKQSLAVFITMMSQMLLMVIIAIACVALTMLGLGLLSLVLVFVLLSVLAVVITALLLTLCARRYEALSV